MFIKIHILKMFNLYRYLHAIFFGDTKILKNFKSGIIAAEKERDHNW